MRAVALVVRGEAWRRRWSWLALAVLVALVGGAVLAGASAARRTERAFPDFQARYGYDAEVYATMPTFPAPIARLRDVASYVAAPFYLNDYGTIYANGAASGAGVQLPVNPTLIIAMSPTVEARAVKLSSGAYATGIHQIDVGYELAQAYHLHVGSVVVIPFYAPDQAQVVYSSSGNPAAHGPTERFTVAGIAVSDLDFPATTPSYSLYLSPAFRHEVGPHTLSGAFGFVRLHGGAAALPQFTYTVNHFRSPAHGFVGAQSLDDATSAVSGSIHPQAVGWWIVALLAALAGIALVAQALSRQSVVAREQYATLSAIGMRPVQLFAVGIARAAVVAAGGVVGALALATALSPLTPVGEARAAEPTTGFVFDPVVFGLGAVAIFLGVLALGVWPAWRDAQVSRLTQREARSPGVGASRVATAVARTGAAPTAVVGVRHALERGRGRSSVPVGTALVGTVVAVGALVATGVFGTSLSALLTTPRLYGEDFQAVFNSLSGTQVTALAHRLDADPAVVAVSYAQSGKYLKVNGVSVDASLVVASKGPLVLSVASGRDPTGPGEIALGTQTMRSAGSSVGSTVTVSAIGPTGRTSTGTFHLVGSMVFPPAVSTGGGLGDGAVVPLAAALDFVCGSGPHAGACRQLILSKLYSPSNFSWGMAVRVAPTAAGRQLVHRLDRTLASYAVTLAVPTNLVNFGQAVNFPLLLGVTLAIFGVAMLIHLLVASASRRRREFALLKVLGFVRRQVRATVTWQATTVAAVGIALGVPLGLVVGNLTWQAFASDLGVVPLTVVSILGIVLTVLGVVAASVVLSVAPAAVAARTRPGLALRQE